VWGDRGRDECPAKSARIVDIALCQRAAIAAGKIWNNGITTSPAIPSGCHVSTYNNNVFFNTIAVGSGSGSSIRRLLCAVATGTPPALGRANTCTGAYFRRCGVRAVLRVPVGAILRPGMAVSALTGTCEREHVRACISQHMTPRRQ
jgi:hypothetical protein